MKRRIKRFNEMISPEIKKELGLSKFDIDRSDTRYFFDKKRVEEIYDIMIFTVTVYELINKPNCVIVPFKIEYKYKEYELFMVLTYEEDVHFGSKTGSSGVNDLRRDMDDETWEKFELLTHKILNDHIPIDFWEIRRNAN